MTDDNELQVRLALVGAVTAGMREAGYEPPKSTLEIFRRWVTGESVDASEMIAALRMWRVERGMDDE